MAKQGYEIPPPRRGDADMPSLWDAPTEPTIEPAAEPPPE